MYDPEASVAAQEQFDIMQRRVDDFIQGLINAKVPEQDAQMLGNRLTRCVDLIRRSYDEYLNEFDPDKKDILHKEWHRKVDEFVAILQGMAERL